MEYPLVYVIILVWNGKRWLENCLGSVTESDYPNFRALVVDNCSTDGSDRYIRENFPDVALIKNRKNYGFARGNNVGIKAALENGADYIILLNQDTRVSSSWISELVRVGEANPSVGILTPMQYNYEGTEIDENFRNNVLQMAENRCLSRDVHYVSNAIGAALCIKSSVLRHIGYLDDLYFLYGEDEDFCRRALYYGYWIGVVAGSQIFHWHSLLDIQGKNRFNYNFLKRETVFPLKDIRFSYLKNIYIYFRYVVKKLARRVAEQEGSRKFSKFLRLQFWIIFNLPKIGYRHFRDRNRGGRR